MMDGQLERDLGMFTVADLEFLGNLHITPLPPLPPQPTPKRNWKEKLAFYSGFLAVMFFLVWGVAIAIDKGF